MAIAKQAQAFGVWLVGAPYEGPATHLSSRWRILRAEGPDLTTNRADDLDRGGGFWPAALSEPTLAGAQYFTIRQESATHPPAVSTARAQTAATAASADSFIVAVLDPATPNDPSYDFTFGLRSSGTGSAHTSYRCKVECLGPNDTIRFSKYAAGSKATGVGGWAGDLGPPRWRLRFEVTTEGSAVRLSASVWTGSAWELRPIFYSVPR